MPHGNVASATAWIYGRTSLPEEQQRRVDGSAAYLGHLFACCSCLFLSVASSPLMLNLDSIVATHPLRCHREQSKASFDSIERRASLQILSQPLVARESVRTAGRRRASAFHPPFSDVAVNCTSTIDLESMAYGTGHARVTD